MIQSHIKSVTNMLSQQKTAIYIRVSTHWQVDKDSLVVQQRELTAYCNLVLGIKDYVVFTDPGYSAKNTARPDYQRMMSRLRTGEFSHLLVWKIDRISRNLLDFAEMYNELKQLGVTFVSKNEQFDTSNAIGEAMLKIILVFAELERNMTSERVTAVMLSRASNGQWNGGRVPYGYLYDKNTMEFSLDPVESKIAMNIFETYEARHSTLYIANMLNDQGITTRTGSKWGSVGIHKILTNPFYYGAYRYNVRDGENGPKRDSKEWVIVENHHVPLISKQRHNEIMYSLKRNKRGGNQKGQAVQKKNSHIFAGILECGECGSMLTATPGKHRADGWAPSTYGCHYRRKSQTACNSKFITDATLAPFIVQYLANMIKTRSLNPEQLTIRYLEKSLLHDAIFDDISHIEDEGLKQLLSLLKDGKIGLELSPKTILPEEQMVVNERTALEDQRRRYDIALNRLKALFLYGDNEIPEKDFITERKRIIDAMNEIDAKLTEMDEEDNSLLASSEEFTQKASYFIMVDALMGNKSGDPAGLVRSIDPSVIKSFVNTVISKIVIRNGTVDSIHFRNGMVHKFVYK